MADPNLLGIWRRLDRAYAQVTILEDDDDFLGLVAIPLTQLRDVVTPAVHERVAALVADGRWEAAGEVSRVYIDILEKALWHEVERKGFAPVAKVVAELRAALDTIAAGDRPATGEWTPISRPPKPWWKRTWVIVGVLLGLGLTGSLKLRRETAFSGDSPTIAQSITAIVYLRDLRGLD